MARKSASGKSKNGKQGRKKESSKRGSPLQRFCRVVESREMPVPSLLKMSGRRLSSWALAWPTTEISKKDPAAKPIAAIKSSMQKIFLFIMYHSYGKFIQGSFAIYEEKVDIKSVFSSFCG